MKKKASYIIAITTIVLGITGYTIYGYMYKAHRDIASEGIDYNLTSDYLQKAMRVDSTSKKIIDRVIQTEGVITSIEQNSVVINDAIQVNFTKTDISNLQPQTKLTIKGRCVGYDDLLELVKIDQAIITNQ
ncbi:MAG: hypothetical protein ACON5F_05670 [Jejuia sp.]